MNNKVTVIKYCYWCGDPFEVKSPNQKYCHPDNKKCSQEAKRESWRKAASKYRKNYKGILQISQVYKLGSGLLSSKPQNDFDKEYLAILKERKRLKLNSVLLGAGIWTQFVCRLFGENGLQRGVFPIFEAYPEVYPKLLVLILVIIGIIVFGAYYK